jgi:hypothetical protein
LAIRFSAPPAPVNHTAQTLEQFRQPMNLVEDHQLAFVIGKVADGIGQLEAVGLVFKVQIHGRSCFSDLQGQRRLAGLSRT